MCNLAGYTGSRRAAPILIDMLRREQFIDGGCCTGIATIDDGKLYYTKVIGDVDALLRETDAINFPGTVGIAHSRPGANYVSHAHPFVDRDEKLAVVLNGTERDVGTPAYFEHIRDIMQGLLDRGFPIRSAVEKNGPYLPLSNGLSYHDTEPFSLLCGDLCDKGASLAEAMGKALTEMPADIVTLSIRTAEPDTVTIGKITRPMTVGLGDGETFVATTSIAFPEDAGIRTVIPAPAAMISTVRPGTFAVTPYRVESVRVQPITHDITAKAYRRLEELLTGREDDPLSVYDMPFFTDWKDLWKEPYVECEYKTDRGLLKPYSTLMYELLETFSREGRLHSRLGERNGHRIEKYWLDAD